MIDLAPSMVIEFDPPLEWNGGKYDAIELREPKISELEKAMGELKNQSDGQTLIRFQIALVCAVTGKPRQVIEQMPVSRMNEAFRYLEGFTTIGQETPVS